MSQPWPELPVAAWQDTRDTVHLWTQVVGKVRMALAPPENHWWHVPCYVNATGLTTSLMPYGDGGLEVEFDFVGHQLIVRTTLGETESFPLEPMTVAAFYRRFTAVLADLGIRVPILARPVEVPTAIPFADDNAHHSYDPVAMHRFWLSLVSAQRVFSSFRGEFTGKGSPVHFFWGAFDLAVTRFSGRPAPRHPGGVPNCPDRVMREAYNRELPPAGTGRAARTRAPSTPTHTRNPRAIAGIRSGRPRRSSTPRSGSSCCRTPRSARPPTRTPTCWSSCGRRSPRRSNLPGDPTWSRRMPPDDTLDLVAVADTHVPIGPAVYPPRSGRRSRPRM